MAEPTESFFTRSSSKEEEARLGARELFAQCPIPEAELLGHLGLFASRRLITRFLLMHELYQRILDVQGVILEFGCRWGQNLALFSSFRGMYEPYNYGRRIVGFDTFEGFPSIAEEDGAGEAAVVGGYGVTPGYEAYLEQLLAYHEQESPISHIRKFELVKGDVTETVASYLEAHPETVVALAYFDMGLYEPTKYCLEAIRPYLTRGSVLGFNQLTYGEFPGETVALRETLGLDSLRIHRAPGASLPSYVVLD